MKVPCRWLAEYVAMETTERAIDHLAERLTFAGLEVEGVARTGTLSRAVVGRVVSSEPVADSDHLTLCRVEIEADGDPVDIVCGAPNVRDGALVPVVLPGGELPNGWKIETRKLRGHVSNGMICSKAELGLEEKSEGIWNFDPALDLSVGDDLTEMFEFDDVILDIKVPSNRPDCASVYGIAREAAAVLDKPLAPLPVDIDETLPPIDGDVRIEIEDPADTPRYTARLMEGVAIGPAPLRMQHRLIKAGMRPLWNVVDATNYVMLELGSPLHPFDADLVSEPIGIRRAAAGETFVTLDDVERTLTSETLMITDRQGGLALAGVMGGQRSEIRPETTRVLLEAATFFGYGIRKSSRSVGLRSEASQRFERGLDPEGVPFAAARAVHWIQKLTGCRVHRGHADAYPAPSERRSLRLRPTRAAALLGLDLDRATCIDILRRLQIEARPEGDDVAVDVPYFRPDLEREVDLIEEVGRIYGYDRLESRSPRPTLQIGRKDKAELDKDRIRAILSGLGLCEVMGDGFDKKAWREALGLPVDDLVTTVNPMTIGQSAMRSSLLPALLGIVDTNLRQGVDGGAIYELGRIFSRGRGEREALGAALFGRTGVPLRGKEIVDATTAKGILDNLFAGLRLDDVETTTDDLPPFLHPGRATRFVRGGAVIGFLGELSPTLGDRFALRTTVLVFEFDTALLTEHTDDPIVFAKLPQLPASKRDLSVSAPIDLPEAKVHRAIAAEPEVETLLLYDVYQGEQVAAGRKSLTYEMALRAEGRTLTDADADEIVRRIESRLAALDVHIRT